MPGQKRKITAPTQLPQRERAFATVGEKLLDQFTAGNLRILPYADPGMDETEEMRRTYRKHLIEPAIKAALYSKVFGTSSLDPVYKPNKRPHPLGKTAAALLQAALENLPMGIQGLVEDILIHALIGGHMLGEKVWEVNRMPGEWQHKFFWKAIKPKDPEIYRLETDEFFNVLAVDSRRTVDRFSLQPFILYTHLPLYHNPQGQSDLRATWREFWVIDTATKMHAVGLERWVHPYFIVKSNDPNVRRQIARAIKNAKGNAFVDAPLDAVVESVTIALNSEKFESAIRIYMQRIFLSITGAFLQAIEGVATGARSIGEVHQDTSQLIIWYLKRCIAEVINKQLVPDLILVNLGPDVPLPTVEFGGLDQAEILKSLQIDQALLALGFYPSIEDVEMRTGRKYERDPALQLKPPQSTTGMGGGGLTPNNLRTSAPSGFADAPPKVEQTTAYTCGPASLAAAFAYFGVPGENEQTLAKKLGTTEQDGTPPEPMAALAKAKGLTAEERHGMTPEDLAQLTSEGKLILCPIQDHGSFSEMQALQAGHYVLVYQAEDGQVRYEDPAAGLEAMDAEEFNRRWIDTDGRGNAYVRYGIVMGPAAEAFADDAPEAPKTKAGGKTLDEVALAGKDGRTAAELLAKAKRQGAATLADLCESAFGRLLKSGNPQAARSLFSEDERQELADSLAATNGVAELLGRSRIRLRAAQASQHFAEWNESSRPRADDGKFGSGGGSSGGGKAKPEASTPHTPEAAAKKVGSILERAKAIPGHLMAKVKTKYAELEGRYGRKAALAIVGAGILAFPLPGGMAVPAVMVGVAELHKRLTAGAAHADAFAELTPEQISEAAAEFLDSLREPLPDSTDFACFADTPIRPQPPEKALSYFNRLVPTLNVDAEQFAAGLERESFTLAAATEQTLLERAKQILSESLATGEGGRFKLADLLESAGVSPANPQYAELCTRTQMMNALNKGAMQEMQDPDVRETFPVWQWLGIRDGRERYSHERFFDKYFPNSVSMEQVRDKSGFDGFNERCSFAPVDKWTWAELQKNGARLETSW